MGDALHQFPVAHQWAIENRTNIEVGLGGRAQCLKPILEQQMFVSEVHFLDGITNDDIGGQPWDFGWGLDRKVWEQVFHLGFREFPSKGLMRATYDLVPLRAPFEQLWSMPILEPHWTGPAKEKLPLVLHGTKSRPNFYQAMMKCWPLIAKTFAPILWAGRPDEWPQSAGFQGDGLPLVEVARHIAESALVFAASSGIAALAGAQGAPCLRIGEQALIPNSIWNNPGVGQYSVPYGSDPIRVLEKVLEEQPWKASAVSLTA
jgi:hypothetical protein